MTDNVLNLEINYITSEEGDVDFLVVSNMTEVETTGLSMHIILCSVNKISVRQDPELKNRLLVLFTEHIQRIYEKNGIKVKFPSPEKVH